MNEELRKKRQLEEEEELKRKKEREEEELRKKKQRELDELRRKNQNELDELNKRNNRNINDEFFANSVLKGNFNKNKNFIDEGIKGVNLFNFDFTDDKDENYAYTERGTDKKNRYKLGTIGSYSNRKNGNESNNGNLNTLRNYENYRRRNQMNLYIYPPNNMKNLFDMREKVLLEEE